MEVQVVGNGSVGAAAECTVANADHTMDSLIVESEVDGDALLVKDVIEFILNKVTGPAKGEAATSPAARVATTCEAQVFTTAKLVPYRDADDGTSGSTDSDSDSTSSESESSESSSDSDIAVVSENIGQKRKRAPWTRPQPTRSRGIKTPGELDIEDLPPIEDLHITLPKEELHPVGLVYSIVDQLLVIESIAGQPALDLESVLFRSGGDPVGQVFDVFGPVANPYYVVRFNKPEDITEKGYQKGDPVYYAPLHADMTQYVFVSELKKIKGSDASWEHDVEPPPEHLDYSDDEQEREARRIRKGLPCKTDNVWRRTDPPSSQRRGSPTARISDAKIRETARKRQTLAHRLEPRMQTQGAGSQASWSQGCGSRFQGPGYGGALPQVPSHSSSSTYMPPHVPPPHWICSPPPQFGSPCQWPNGNSVTTSLNDRQLLGQLWSTPPPPPPPVPFTPVPPTLYGGNVAQLGPPPASFPIQSPQWNIPPLRSDSPGSEHAGWTQWYDPVPDLQRILMTPPPPLQ